MKRGWLWIGIGVLALAALTVVSCGGSESSGDPEEVELRSYTVPEGFDRGEWQEMLNASFRTGETKIGTATRGPANTLVVTAPRSVHEGVERLLDDLVAKGPAERSEPQSVSLNYWIILEKPVEGQSTQSPIAAGRLGQMGNLEPVLTQIASAHGPMEYHLLEQLQLASVDGNWSEVRGRQVKVRQRFSGQGAGVHIAEISIAMQGSNGLVHNLDSRIKLEPGKFIVLGQTAYDAGGAFVPAGLDPKDDLMLYYVIAAQSD